MRKVYLLNKKTQNKECLKNKFPISAKRFFNIQRRKRRHSRATSRLSDRSADAEVYWKISHRTGAPA